MSEEIKTEHLADISRKSLWFGFFFGGLAWGLEGFIGWVISSRACFIGHGNLGPISPGGVRWILAGVTIVLLGLTIYGAVNSYRNWRHISLSPRVATAEGNESHEFISQCGVIISSIMAFGIIWAGLVLIFIDVCVRER